MNKKCTCLFFFKRIVVPVCEEKSRLFTVTMPNPIDRSGVKITSDSVLVPRDNKVFNRQTLPPGAYFQAGLRSVDQALPIGVLYINSFEKIG